MEVTAIILHISLPPFLKTAWKKAMEESCFHAQFECKAETILEMKFRAALIVTLRTTE